jgi:Rrf2 family protein
VDMTLSKRGDYVMRSAISLARAFEQGMPRKIREVVAETDVPRTFASQVLADLVRAGLAESKAGRNGGYRLARPPAKVSVLEVVEAAEGPLRAERCALGEGPCRWEAVCPLHETWSAATAAIQDLLSRTTLAELAARDAAIEAGAYQVPADAHRSYPTAVKVSDLVHVELGEAGLAHALLRVRARLRPLLLPALLEPAGTRSGEPPSSKLRRQPKTVTEVALAPVAPRGPKWPTKARPTKARPTKAKPTRAKPKAEGPGHYLLSWHLAGPGLACRFDADVRVSALDPQRSEVRVEGTWYQLPTAGAMLAKAELEQKAHATVRCFLRNLARALERDAASKDSLPSPQGGAARSGREQRRTALTAHGSGRGAEVLASGTTTSTTVPWPRAERTSARPPSSFARSRMPSNPR